ncbi:MAG: T9SS type A sorting domain-containing protein [Bacteroidota bacterium]
MKNIKYPLFILMQLLVFQLVAQSQDVLNNGRPASTVPGTPVVENATPANTDNLTEIDDADIPGTYYLRGGSEEAVVYGEEGPANLLERLDNMEAEMEALRLQNEQLAKENQTIKMEMSSCCAEAAGNMNLPGSYLMQNSPNPFQTDTNIQYFIEDAATKAKIEIRNTEGVLLQSFNLDQKGIGNMSLDRRDFADGSYVYTLSVDGKIVDSKVMILQ